MSYRNIIAAATLGTAVAFGSIASAESYFGEQMVADMDAKTITLDVVTADEDGFVLIYDYTGAEFGEVFGSAPINAGANAEVLVGLNGTVTGNLIAVLYAGEMPTDVSMADPALAAATLEIDVQDS